MFQIVDAYMVLFKRILHPLIDGVQYLFGITFAIILHMNTHIRCIVFHGSTNLYAKNHHASFSVVIFKGIFQKTLDDQRWYGIFLQTLLNIHIQQKNFPRVQR